MATIYITGCFAAIIATFFEVYFEREILILKGVVPEECFPKIEGLLKVLVPCLASWIWCVIALILSKLNANELRELKNSKSNKEL